jgi:hypothetical protein
MTNLLLKDQDNFQINKMNKFEYLYLKIDDLFENASKLRRIIKSIFFVFLFIFTKDIEHAT